MKPIIEIQNLSKLYFRGDIARGSMRDTFQNIWNRLCNKEMERRGLADPTLARISPEQEGPTPDSFWALKNLNLAVKQGECIGVTGANGVGKSTLLKILSRLTEPTEGRAILRGRAVGLLEVGTGFHPDLTGRENVYLNGAFLGMKKKEIDKVFDEIVAFAGVEEFIDSAVKFYSSGMAMRLAFSVASHLRSDILLLDEVFEVADPAFQLKCIDRMQEGQKLGKTIVFVSHNTQNLSRMCSRTVVIEKGRVTNDGPTQSVLEHYLRT